MARVWAELTPEELLALGQLGGISDNTVIYKDNSGVIQALSLGASGTVLTSGGPTSAPTFSSTSGVGDVEGPVSSVNNNVVFFDGTTGKLIKDSGLALSGSNTGDQTSMSGISDTKANFDTACSDGNFVYTGDDITGKSASTDALNSATTTVNVSSATAPTSGQVLTATSDTTAEWQTPSAGGSSSAPQFAINVDGVQIVGELYTYVVNSAVTAGTFRTSLKTLPGGATLIVNLLKNGTIDATCTHTAGDSATNGLYQQTDTTFTSGSYISGDVLTVEVTQVGTTVSGSGLTVSLFE